MIPPASSLLGRGCGGYNAGVKKCILITNDDGVHAPGILALKQAVEDLGDVYVVAPDRGRSACGHGITLHKPLRAQQVRLADGSTAWSSSGLPTDCIHIGVMQICPRKPDIVFSGINLGANLGWELTYSGTVAGAMEGAAFGVPSIAVSVTTYEEGDVYGPAARFARYLADHVMTRPLPDGSFLNVNVPAVAEEDIRGIAITRLGIRRYPGRVDVRKDPLGRTYYWLGGDVPTDGLEEGTDLLAVQQRQISVTPVHLDLTSFGAMESVREWSLEDYPTPTTAPTAG